VQTHDQGLDAAKDYQQQEADHKYERHSSTPRAGLPVLPGGAVSLLGGRAGFRCFIHIAHFSATVVVEAA
jgi:hypothetical protein